MKKHTVVLACAHHPATLRERAGECERVVVGRQCPSQITVTIEGPSVIGAGLSELVDEIAARAGWSMGHCPLHDTSRH